MRVDEYINQLANNIHDKFNVKTVISTLTSDEECVAVRVLPSGNLRYYDKNRDINLSFQILVKSKKQSRTAMLIGLISEYLDKNGAYIYVEPSYLEHDERGYIYTASFNRTI
ncbi:hypothetical protein [Helcococcus kunzii]|uniref:hypothetical protein n=1 Tax=Helcococcus kunzii TaxID=40091 RepID=UPI0038B027A8